jgi:RNA polymerase sigma-70 factor (ECF subfamily)
VDQDQLSSLGDDALVLLVAEGDLRAFEAIYDRHSAQAFGLAVLITGRRGAAEEVTQDVFLGFWRAAGGYDRNRGAFRTWLHALVRHRAIDWLRREARHGRNVEIDDALAQRLQAADCTEDEVADRDESSRARRSLSELPTEQRRVIELAYFGGLTQAEIAARVNIPLGTVKGRQRLALQKLQRRLKAPAGLALSAPAP